MGPPTTTTNHRGKYLAVVQREKKQNTQNTQNKQQVAELTARNITENKQKKSENTPTHTWKKKDVKNPPAHHHHKNIQSAARKKSCHLIKMSSVQEGVHEPRKPINLRETSQKHAEKTRKTKFASWYTNADTQASKSKSCRKIPSALPAPHRKQKVANSWYFWQLLLPRDRRSNTPWMGLLSKTYIDANKT